MLLQLHEQRAIGREPRSLHRLAHVRQHSRGKVRADAEEALREQVQPFSLVLSASFDAVVVFCEVHGQKVDHVLHHGRAEEEPGQFLSAVDWELEAKDLFDDARRCAINLMKQSIFEFRMNAMRISIAQQAQHTYRCFVFLSVVLIFFG